jgi:acyl-coenzyme A thioesterase 9
MTSKLRSISLLSKALCSPRTSHIRTISSSSRCLTDGVYGELTAMRTRTPFIEAFRKQQQGENGTPAVPTDHLKRDLSPKTMSDSLTRVVSLSFHPPSSMERYYHMTKV